MLLNPKFDYKPLTREEREGRRLYATPSGAVPSVTTILDSTKDKTFLIEWRKRVGEQQANQISKEASGLGTLMHKHLENYVLGIDRPKGNNTVQVMATAMADTMIREAFCDIDEVWGIETGLFYPELYAGTTDMVGMHKGKPAIIDHKTTNKPKKKEWIEDYFLQCCAYALAHNSMYGTDINKAVVNIIDRDAKLQSFVIEGAEFDIYSEKWVARVDQYYASR
jgi:genome maintenance exonuclease 1